MKNYTKLAVFDLDGTLLNTPTPEEGMITYMQKTGNKWPHIGWWSKPESLDMDIFDIKPIESVISDYHREKSNPDTMVIMLTGRIKKLSPEVEVVLKKYNLSFDGYYYKMGGASTDQSKINTMNSILEMHPSIKSVEMWDDRLSHVPIFEQWGKETCMSGRLDDFNINVIFSNHH